MCRCYSIPKYILHQRYNDENCTPFFDDYIHYCNPTHFQSSITTALIKHVGFSDDITFSNSKTAEHFQYYLTTRSPTTSDSTVAYHKDSDTRQTLAQLQLQKVPSWSDDILNQITPEYHLYLKRTQIKCLHDKLILIKLIFKNIRYVGLIIAPLELGCVIFSHYHAGPSGGHMGGYKALFRIRTRF